MFIKKIKSLGVKRGLTYFTLSSFAGFSLFGIGYTIQQIKKRDADAARTIVLTDDRSYNPTNPSSAHNNIGPLFTVLFKEWILSFLDENRDDQEDFLRNAMAGYFPTNKKAKPFFGNIKQIKKDLKREQSKPIPSDKKQQNQLKDNIEKLKNRLKGTLSLQEYLANEIFNDTSKLTSDQKTELKKLAQKVKDHRLKFKFSENYGSIFKLNDGLQQGVKGQKILPNLMFLYSDNFYNFYNNLWRNKFPLGLPRTQQNKDSSPELKINEYGYINNKNSIVKGIYQNSADPNDPNEDKNAKLLMVPFGKSFSNFMFVNKGLLAEMLYILGQEDLIFDDGGKEGFKIKGVKSWNDFQNLSLLKIKDKETNKEITNKYPYTPSLTPLYSNQKSGIFTPLSRLTEDAFKKLGLEHYRKIGEEWLAKIFDDPNEYAKFSTIIYKLVWWQYEYNKAFFEKYIDKKTIIKDGKK
ncbi:MAG: hypothetical protein E7Y34_00745, partial [Mycoplasma sp.]|nr:hypothetical protein [Mycoplasma sp.]